MMPSNSTEYNKQYYQKNKERLREIRGKWNENNVEKMREYRRRYFQEHKDKWREYGKKRTKKYYYQQLEEENQTLKDNIEFLHQCLDDRDKSIELMKEELGKLVMSKSKDN